MTSPESYFRETERSLLIRNQELREENERLRRIEEAMERIVAIDHMRLGWGEEIQRIARAALADQPAEE